MADILPECLIQKILSLLTYKEASKMSILSKTWLQAWSTLPDLEFILHSRKCNIKIVDTIMERYRDGKVPIKKFELSSSLLFRDPHKFISSIDKFLDVALQNGVEDLVLDYKSYPTPISTILATKSLRKLVLSFCILMPVSLASGVVNQNSLRNLSLYHVKLDKNTLETLLTSCPLIDTFIFVHCSGLEKFDDEVYLQKIKSVSRKVLKISDVQGIWEIDAPNLVSFEYIGKHIPEFNKIAREQMEHSKVFLYRLNHINADWFCKFRNFLSKSTSWSQVSFSFMEFTEIKMEDLEQHHRVGATTQVDVLEVDVLFQQKPCSSFVDALVWSCLPRRLNLKPLPKMFTVFSDRLMYMKNSSTPPWHSQLKEIKAFDEKNQLLTLPS